ncbi:MAG: DoxX family protein [Rhodocyclaceae bacterium]|nr:DoxX family protein [Rhodocyclaceae bacterium]
MKNILRKTFSGIDWLGLWLGMLALRLVLGWEFFDAGLEKFRGANWFADIQDKFPAPFNAVPPEISWQMATWFELVGGIALIIGLGTRFFGASLFILTIVATASVHWPGEWATLAELVRGYAITDQGQGNFKLPVIFMAMLLPLIFSGPGKLSLDHLIARRFLGRQHA